MLALEAAIQAKYATLSSVTASMGTDLWVDVPPDGVPLPTAIMSTVSAPLDTVYGEAKTSQPVVQFAFYGADRTETGTAMEAFVDAMDVAALTLDRGKVFFTLRLKEPTASKVPDRDAVNGYVWRWLVQYRFAVRNP